MRARSAHLRTSWWVVVVWAALGILTGVISVVTVLQPTWYVRYTLIHAQALQDVTFQVVVSSVGPLGFCRLTAVETHQVIDSSNVPSVFKKTFSTPSNNFQKTTAVTDSVESFRFPDSMLTSKSLSGPLEVTKKPEYEMWKSTEAPPESFHTLRAADESFQEWPPPGVHYSNSSFEDSLVSLSPPDPTGKDTDEKSNSDGVRVSEGFQISTITDKGITAGKSDGIGDVLFRVTEKYLNVIYEEREKFSDNGHPDDKNRTVTLQERKKIGMPDVEHSITEKGFISHGDQDVGDSRRQDVDNGLKFMRENATGVNEFNTHNNKKNSHTSYRRRKKKKKQKKKKKKKKKTRNKKKRKNTLHRLKFKKIKGSFYDGSSSKLNDVIGTTVVEVNNNSFFNRHQSSKSNMTFNEEEIIAESVIQQDEPTAYERNTVAIDYQPRTPIMLCSGVTVGIGSGSSAVWVLVGVVYGVAGVVQVLAGVASIITQAVHSPAGRYAHAIWVGNVQVAVVMSQGVTLVLFPLGLGSPLARVECGGSSSVYWPGDCTFGWAYMLAIVATTLAAYCPCLARLTVYKRYALREWESLNFF